MADSQTSETTAFHEAGHVVAYWTTYRDVEFCSIRPDVGHEGRTRLHPPDHDRPSDRADWRLEDLVDEIVGCLAGQLAEERLGGSGALGAGYQASHDDGISWLASGSDAERTWDLVTAISADPNEQTACLYWLGIRTSVLLDRYWHTVEAVAQALLEQEDLIEADLEALRREHAYPRFPEGEGT